MHNCLGAKHYTDKCAKGVLAVYRLIEPERCTVALRIDGSNLAIHDFAAASNKPPGPAATAVIRRWLNQAGHQTACSSCAQFAAAPAQRGRGAAWPVRPDAQRAAREQRELCDLPYDDMPF
jgi:hypothetical protein